jgi:hypothetical protein
MASKLRGWAVKIDEFLILVMPLLKQGKRLCDRSADVCSPSLMARIFISLEREMTELRERLGSVGCAKIGDFFTQVKPLLKEGKRLCKGSRHLSDPSAVFRIFLLMEEEMTALLKMIKGSDSDLRKKFVVFTLHGEMLRPDSSPKKVMVPTCDGEMRRSDLDREQSEVFLLTEKMVWIFVCIMTLMEQERSTEDQAQKDSIAEAIRELQEEARPLVGWWLGLVAEAGLDDEWLIVRESCIQSRKDQTDAALEVNSPGSLSFGGMCQERGHDDRLCECGRDPLWIADTLAQTGA